MRVDLAAVATSFALPVFIIQGTSDVWTPAELSRAFVDRLTAPEKAFIPIEGAGHSALVRDSNQFLKAMNDRVRPKALYLKPPPRRCALPIDPHFPLE